MLFGIYHLQLVQGLYAVCLGLLLAAACEKCGGLGAAFLVHAVSNLTAVVLSLEGREAGFGGKKSLFSFSHPDFRPYSYPVCPKDVENGGDGDENFIAIKFILWYYHF